MQAILNKDVAKLGYRGDIVKVKNGYFRNFLFPRGLAILATETSVRVAKSRQEKVKLVKQKLLDNAKEALAKIKGLKITFKKKATSKGKLYGAITENDVSKSIEESHNIKLEKEWIKMEHIKTVGEHKAVIHLGPDLEQEVEVVVKEA